MIIVTKRDIIIVVDLTLRRRAQLCLFFAATGRRELLRIAQGKEIEIERLAEEKKRRKERERERERRKRWALLILQQTSRPH